MVRFRLLSIICRFIFSSLLITFSVFAYAQQPIVLILSAKDALEVDANQQLLVGIKRALPQSERLAVVKLETFLQFEQAWQHILTLNPKLIIGPLQKHSANLVANQAIHQAKPIPVISLNRVMIEHPLIWQFALTDALPAYQLAKELAEQDIQSHLLLAMNSDRSLKLMQQFLDVSDAKATDQLIYNNTTQLLASFYLLTGFHKSRQRIESIQSLIGQPLDAIPWLRQDAQALILFSPLTHAIEISHQLGQTFQHPVTLYWIDSGSHSVEDYVRSSANWGNVKTFMPTYLIQAMKRESTHNENFFSALGQDVVSMALHRLSVFQATPFSFRGNLGRLELDRQGLVQLNMPLVWLTDGSIHVLDMNETE